MKKLLIILLLASGAQAQERITPPSKYEKFLSDRGSMITKDYYNLPTLKGKYSSPDVQVVVLTSSAGKGYFYRIRMKTKYSDKTAVISRDDLTEVQRALTGIRSSAKADADAGIEYRERYFVTDDGFKVGYVQNGKEQTFFAELDDYQSDDTLFFHDPSAIADSINLGIAKIEELVASGK